MHIHKLASSQRVLCFTGQPKKENGVNVSWQTYHVTACLAMTTLVAVLIAGVGLEVGRQRALDYTGHCEGSCRGELVTRDKKDGINGEGDG